MLSAGNRGEAGAQTGSGRAPPGVPVPSPRSSQTTGATEKILTSNIAQYHEITQRDY